MKVLSVMQPHASFIAWNIKTIETRSWPTDYRGPLLIHASKRIPAKVRKDIDAAKNPVIEKILWQRNLDIRDLPYGAIIGVVNLYDVIVMENIFIACMKVAEQEQELALGNYQPSRFAWMLEKQRSIYPSIPASGHLGLWDFPNEKLPSEISNLESSSSVSSVKSVVKKD